MICDDYGRSVLNFRISLTQKCNLHCPYCHKEGEGDPSTAMSAEEIVRIAKVATGLDIFRVKLTGGEPLLRKDILDIVGGIAKLHYIKDISMTTNGTFLKGLAKDLRARGLNRVNVSLLTLNPRIYHKLMGGNIRDVLEGIRAAVEAELYPVKLNMLMLKNINEREIEKMIQFAQQNMTILQIIELEPLNVSREYYQRYHVDLEEVEQMLLRRALEVKTRKLMQNRRVYFLPRVKVEVIHPIDNTEFCSRCTRIRLTSDGKLKPCLMRDDNLVDILTPLRDGANDEELTRLFLEAIKSREPFYKEAN